MSADRTHHQIQPQHDMDPDEARKAAKFVASQAHDAEDCAELLQMLGLMHPGWEWKTRRQHSGVQGRRKIYTTGADRD